VNLPSGLLFPAAGKLLGAGNARSLAAHAIMPYLKKVTACCPACDACPSEQSLSIAAW
jgi:hypothetical protein